MKPGARLIKANEYEKEDGAAGTGVQKLVKTKVNIKYRWRLHTSTGKLIAFGNFKHKNTNPQCGP